MKNNLFRKLGIYGEETPDNVEEEIISMVNEGHEHGAQIIEKSSCNT